MADHEAQVAARSWWARVWAQITYRAKAFLAGIGALVASELVVLLTDASFQEQVKGAVPPAYAFLVPVAFGIIVGVITHQVANGPKPSGTETSAE